MHLEEDAAQYIKDDKIEGLKGREEIINAKYLIGADGMVFSDRLCTLISRQL